MSAPSTVAAPAASRPMPWLIITAGSLIAVLTFGPRSAMGFFQLPMLQDTGWDRTTFGLAMAFQNRRLDRGGLCIALVGESAV